MIWMEVEVHIKMIYLGFSWICVSAVVVGSFQGHYLRWIKKASLTSRTTFRDFQKRIKEKSRRFSRKKPEGRSSRKGTRMNKTKAGTIYTAKTK